MAYNIFRGAVPPQRFENDVKALRKVPATTLDYLIPLGIKHFIDSIPITPDVMKEIKEKTNLSEEMLVRSIRVLVMFLVNSPLIKEEELKSDLERAQLSAETIDIMMKHAKQGKSLFLKFNQKESSEAIPKLSELNWRVDIRLDSSDGFSEPFPVALIRLAVNDNLRTERIYFELDKDGLSYLETTLNKIKAAFTKVDASKNRIANQVK